MINDIPTFLEIISKDHLYRPDDDKIPDQDVKEVEDLCEQLEAFVDRMISGPSENYGEIALLSDRVQKFLICLLLDELSFWRTQDAK